MENNKWLDPYEGLNETQREVVAHDDGAAIVCAVAGSGKTRTVVNRIARMVRDGVDPDKILATTFTRKAAGEMNERLRQMGCPVGRNGGGARVGTFHSVCLEIIHDESPWENYKVDDRSKMHYVLKDILGFREMDWKDADITDVEQFISDCKNALVRPEDVRVHSFRASHGPGETPDGRFREAYQRYETERDSLGLLTFDDMLCLAVWFLQDHKGAGARWGARYEHVMVDEFQDSNRAQYELMRILSKNAKSLLCVGDDDQLIYQFRGSVPEFTLTFEEKFKARGYAMEMNYRSTPEILAAANSVIAHNEGCRIPKVNRPVRENGRPVEFHVCEDMDAEARAVAGWARELHEDGFKWSDLSVLYRVNAQSRAFEEAFISEKIPHVIIGGVEFYKRKEVADILAYLRLAVNSADYESCRRAINRPFRYIGKSAIEKMEDMFGEARYPTLFDVVKLIASGQDNIGLQRRQINSLKKFVDLVQWLKADLAREIDGHSALPQTITELVRRSGYEEWIVRDEGRDTAEVSRISNLRELCRTSGRFKTAGEMLEYMDTVLDHKRNRKNATPDAVQVMTIHKSKGLEFPAVFLAGCADGILPHGRAECLEEERRLFYVGVTRAKDRLFVTCPVGVLVGGREVYLEVSPFVKEAGLDKITPFNSGSSFSFNDLCPGCMVPILNCDCHEIQAPGHPGRCSVCSATMVENDGGKGWRCPSDDGHPTRIR